MREICTLFKRDFPAAPSGTATLLRLSNSYQYNPKQFLDGHHLQVLPTSIT
jgi:hypothetical protein